VKTISIIVLIVALGCAKEQPPTQEKEMSRNTQSGASDAQPTINTMSLTRAVPADDMPPFLQERIKRTPPTVTVEDVRALNPQEREKVLAVVERALEHHLAEAQRHRNRGNPAERTANDLAMFLNAARQ
jgi:hypothetical protein